VLFGGEGSGEDLGICEGTEAGAAASRGHERDELVAARRLGAWGEREKESETEVNEEASLIYLVESIHPAYMPRTAHESYADRLSAHHHVTWYHFFFFFSSIASRNNGPTPMFALQKTSKYAIFYPLCKI
jgi:hypothetical protein